MSASLFDSDAFNSRLFLPRRVATHPPDAVDVRVAVPGASLHLRWHRSQAAAFTVLLFHGNGEVVADYDEVAPLFASAGADLAVVDFRGYGQSTGRPTLRTTILDAWSILEAVASRRRKPIIVMGRSLGCACAAELYGSPTDPAVKGFILESGFTDLAGLVERRGLPPAPITAADRDDFDPLPKLRRGRRPLLVLHGEADELIPPQEGRAAFEAAGAPEAEKSLVLIPMRGHNDLSQSKVYWESVRRFLTSHA